MPKKYSIAETRDNLAAILHDLEKVRSVEITRRGEPVAVILSKKEFDRLQNRQYNFWDAYQNFLQQVDLKEADIDPEEIFGSVRDKSPGRDLSL